MRDFTLPTSTDAELREYLSHLVERMRDTLGRQLAGVYLSGSLASGDIDPASSDIDFIAALNDDLSDGQFLRLQLLHRRLSEQGNRWATHTEGIYLTRPALRRYNPSSPQAAMLTAGGELQRRHEDWDGVFHRSILRECGVTLYGPEPAEFIDPVTPAQLREATINLLTGWWSAQLDDPALFATREYQAFAILTMCRARYTLERGALVSKPAAARWVASRFGATYRGLIERALRWRGDPTPAPETLTEMVEFIRWTIDVATEHPSLPHRP